VLPVYFGVRSWLICTHMCTCVYNYLCMYACTRVCMCICIYACTYIYVCVCISEYVYVYVYVNMCMCGCVHHTMRLCTYMCCLCIRARYVHINVCMCIWIRRLQLRFQEIGVPVVKDCSGVPARLSVPVPVTCLLATDAGASTSHIPPTFLHFQVPVACSYLPPLHDCTNFLLIPCISH
jgi:hypothetical protein